MRSSIGLGKFFGIPVGIHYSWFIVFILVLVSLSRFFFPVQLPGQSDVTYWAMGIVTTILFFASVLGHELSHSVIAIRRGIPVQGITLFIFGGVSQISKDADNPRTELVIAVAGPLSSIVFGIIFGAIALLTQSVSPPVAAVTSYLAFINVFLAVFNLIPGFPLDGGRVLRSIIWSRTKSMKRATRIAARVGQFFSYAFILAGVFYALVLGDIISGVWIAFIGWFLNNAASGSYQQTAIQDILRGSEVKELMTKDFETVSQHMSIEELVENHVLKHGFRAFPVIGNGEELVGIVTLADIKQLDRTQWPRAVVSDVMTPYNKLRIAHPEDDLTAVVPLLDASGINQLPVIGNGKLVGMLTRADLVGFFAVRRELGLSEEATAETGESV